MLIIDDVAEMKLIRALEKLRDEDVSAYCLELQFSKIDREYHPERMPLIELIRFVFPTEYAALQAYFLTDEDVVVITPQLTARQLKLMHTHLPVGSEDYLRLRAFGPQINVLINRVQKKIAARQKAINKPLLVKSYVAKRRVK